MEHMEKNEKIILSDIFNAIKTCQAARGDVEAVGIANAFVREMKADKNCLVLFQNKIQNGKMDKAFVMMKDKSGRTVFPMFTDITKILPIKQTLEKQGQVEIGVMNLKMIITMLAAKQMCQGIIVNPFMQNFNAPLSFFTNTLYKEEASHVILIEADLAALHTDAIVCPTDGIISGTGSVDAMVQQTGGDVFKEAVRAEVQNESLDVADVIAVQSHGELHSRYVLFTNVPEYSEQMKVESIFECYLNCMNAAKELKCTSIAFPCTSAAMKGMPMEAVIGASTKAVTTWLAANQDVKIDVYFCCEKKEEKEMYQKFFDGIKK
ncbi:MAG: macro domain-containing protein [Lachnospiraceae bacterium]|nr:macro domain-containing protein [Lachnospiraceae bacterium]